jgi:hypothetical protein
LSQLGDLKAFQWIEQLIHGMVFFSPGVAVTSQCAATKRKKAVNLEKVGILVFSRSSLVPRYEVFSLLLSLLNRESSAFRKV